jgi:hypothetical protein
MIKGADPAAASTCDNSEKKKMCVAKLVGQSTNDPEFEGLKLPGTDTR